MCVCARVGASAFVCGWICVGVEWASAWVVTAITTRGGNCEVSLLDV